MIEEGKISAGEGAELLKALSQQVEPETVENESLSKQPRRFRLVITDQNGEKKVNVNLPMGLVKVGVKMGARFAPMAEDEDDLFLLDKVKEALQKGQIGKVVEYSSSSGETIEVFVE